ncbi:hypothetical protein FHR47_002301 [Xanthomonas arboricola]|uniref:hypothetical protein n=1 Tax=Xanthomonas cannabis TaxID=1885674 RepID=UPI0016231382|nr:hypothetical protein [Xanthomonas cannabis]MBB3802053.1 hypothetical protein [Xanthomonas cannabis]
MRQQALSAVKAGITRLRDKGGASPDSVYDLLNGYVTAARTIKSRPGTRIALQLPPGTKGLVYFQGKFVVFASTVIAPPSPEVEIEVLRHPSAPDASLADIHFAMPFLGFLYVVAEFVGGDTFHYWLEKGEVWQPNKTYLPGALVRPTSGNGLAYRLEGDRSGYVPWAPNVPRAVGDVVVPIADNGFKYTVIETSGAAARSGTAEPSWPTNAGETIYEDANITNPMGPGNAPAQGATVPTSVSDRYGTGNQGGN